MKAGTEKGPSAACPACGADNRLGVPFCTSCGTRIYQGNAAPPKAKRKQRGGPRRALRNGLIALAVLWLLGSVSLLFWPFPPLVRAKVDSTSSGVRSVIEQAHRALETGDPPPSAMVREGQWNAFVREAHPGDTREMSVYMTNGKLVMVADETTGPFQIGTRLVLVEDKDGDGDGDNGRVRVQSLWVGHLPLPRFLATPWTRSLSKRFGLGLDNRLWDEMDLYRIDSNAVRMGEALDNLP